MSIPKRITEYLDAQGVAYDWLPHPLAYSSQEVAHSLHVSGKHLAKTVLLNADGKIIMGVLPASHRLSLPDLKLALNAAQLEMVPESELTKLFPDCEFGALPPFGNLYGLDVWMDKSLAEAEDFIFTAGSHRDAVRIKSEDYLRLMHPHLAWFSSLGATRAA